MQDENEVVLALKNGEEWALKYFVEKYKQLIFNVCFSFTQNTDNSDDLAQEVFIQAWESIDQFHGESKFSTWLYRIAVNKSLDFVRALQRRERWAKVQSLFNKDGNPVATPVPQSEIPDNQAEHNEQMEIIWKCLQKLPESQKTAFILNKYDDLSYKEIAEIMKISLSAVETNIHRAKEKLKKELKILLNS